jgi:hypothetical protein
VGLVGLEDQVRQVDLWTDPTDPPHPAYPTHPTY